MLYESDFAYFLRDPVPNVRGDGIKRSFISFPEKNHNNFLPSKIDILRKKNENKLLVLNVNEYLKQGTENKNVFKNDAVVMKNRDNQTVVKNLAVKWAKKTSIKKSLVKLFERYCENTTVHGIKYFYQNNQHWSERYKTI